MLKRLKTKDNNIDKKYQIKLRRETRHINTITIINKDNIKDCNQQYYQANKDKIKEQKLQIKPKAEA